MDNKNTKTYYRNGDVPRAQPTSTDGDVRQWHHEGKTIVAQKGSHNVEVYAGDEIVSVLSSYDAYKLGRHVYHTENNKDTPQAQWGKMLCSAAEHAAR